MAEEIGNGSCRLFPRHRWFGSIHWDSDHVVSPSDGCAVTLVKQIGGFRPMERRSHLTIQDPSWQRRVRMIPT